jgi:hypothetical protein
LPLTIQAVAESTLFGMAALIPAFLRRIADFLVAVAEPDQQIIARRRFTNRRWLDGK